jgi:GxxExxY protein
MNYSANFDVSEEIDGRETDPLTKSLPIFYKDVMLDCGYRLDLVVEDQVIIEIKSVSAIAPIHEAQLLSYLKLYGTCARGLLINFNVKRLVEGIRRMKI